MVLWIWRKNLQDSRGTQQIVFSTYRTQKNIKYQIQPVLEYQLWALHNAEHSRAIQNWQNQQPPVSASQLITQCYPNHKVGMSLSHTHKISRSKAKILPLNRDNLPVHSIHLPSLSHPSYSGQGGAKKITYLLIGAREVHFKIYGVCFKALEKMFPPSSTNGFDGKSPGRFSL